MDKIPKKFELLPIDHPTVMRRLCKELNYRPAGFYFNGGRYNQARYSKGMLWIRIGREKWLKVEPMMTCLAFGDGNGGTVTVSRTRCGN